MEFSHHSSNPLEARTSDPTNRRYHRTYNRATQDISMSSDELGRWDQKEEFQQHIKAVIQSKDRGIVTPKAGPSRLRNKTAVAAVVVAAAAAAAALVDLDEDEDMESDDALLLSPAQVKPDSNGVGTLDPRKEFGGAHIDEEHEEEDEEDEEMTPEFTSKHVARRHQSDRAIYSDGEDGGEENNAPEECMEEDEDEDEKMVEQENDFDHRPTRRRSRSNSYSTISATSRSSSLTPLSSPLSSRPSSPDEFNTLTLRPPEEQEEITAEIEQLYKSVPDLERDYHVIDRLGTGTFSSVYKAVDVGYERWENVVWQGHHPPESTAFYQSAGGVYKGRGGRAPGWRMKRRRSTGGDNASIYSGAEDVRMNRPTDGRVFVAIKRIYTTSGPERIRNELSILEDARSCRHVSQIITAFRNEDQVVIVLPYQRNMDFREFYQDLHPEGIKCYFRCLFRALRDIHARGIIHRDVKPANFLYDPFTGVGTLCDFGLASRMDKPPSLGACMHTPFTPTDPHGKIVFYSDADSLWMKQQQKEARAKSAMSADKVGYPLKDRRPVNKANRAGTRGFRAPEVLLKCTAQTGAIDVWAAGVILLFFLTGKFPIFQSNDDVEGLMEITAIIGKKNMERVATLHARTLATNIPDVNHEGITWEDFVEKLNPDLMTPRKYDMRYYPHNSKHRDGRGSMIPPPSSPPTSNSTSDPSSSSNLFDADNENEHRRETDQTHVIQDKHANPPNAERHKKEMTNALSFLDSILHVESIKRATPRKALLHRFLDEGPSLPTDDAYVPHRAGEGICKELHNVELRPSPTGANPHHTERVHHVKLMRKCVCMNTRKEVLRDEVLSPIGKQGSDGYEDEDEVVVDLDVDDDEDDEGGEGAGESKEEARRRRRDERWCGQWVEDWRECRAGEGVAIGSEPCEFHNHLEWDRESWIGEPVRHFI